MLLCQVCGAENPEDSRYCGRCHQKLLVLSGPLEPDEVEEDFTEEPDDNFSFDEHLLERISILEEAVKRTAESLRQLVVASAKQEHGLLVTQTGLTALRDLLEQQGTISRPEWSELWESRMGEHLAALERRERLAEMRDRVEALFRGADRAEFLARLDEAEAALAALDPDRASQALETALRLDRENYELAFLLGETRFDEGDGEGALVYFRRVLAARPDHYQALVYTGVVHHQAGRARPAEEALKRAVALDPGEFLPNFSLGALYAARGQLTLAAVFLERAVSAEPLPQALFLLGSALYEQGKLGLALARLREAVRRDPAFEEAHHLLGLAYLDRGWTQKALSAFREAQRLNPKRLRYDDLVRHLSGIGGAALPRLEGEAGVWLARGEQALDRGHARQAMAALRRALALSPDHPTVLLTLSLAALAVDRGAEGEAAARRLLELAPGEMLAATATAALIEALRGQGKLREGQRVGKRLLAEGASPFSQTVAYYEMAYNLAEMEEDLDQALDYARRAVELAPDELAPFPLAALGWVHYKRREFDKAVDFLDRADALGPSATTSNHLGLALLAAGQEGRAKSAFARARRLERRAGGVEQRLLEHMKDSARLVERARGRSRKS